AAAMSLRAEATRPNSLAGRRSRATASPVTIRSSGRPRGLVGSVGPVEVVYWPAYAGVAVVTGGPEGAGGPGYAAPWPGAAGPAGGGPAVVWPAVVWPAGAAPGVIPDPGAAYGFEGAIHGRLVRMDIDAFVAVHASRWDRLQYLLKQRRLNGAQADELVAHYQATATHLSQVRTHAPDPNLVTRLSALLVRARGRITAVHDPAWAGVGRVEVVSLPGADQ